MAVAVVHNNNFRILSNNSFISVFGSEQCLVDSTLFDVERRLHRKEEKSWQRVSLGPFLIHVHVCLVEREREREREDRGRYEKNEEINTCNHGTP